MQDGVNVSVNNWHATGLNVQVAQYKANVTVTWVDDAGVPQSWTGEVTFPNDLGLVPLAWLKEAITELLVKAGRKRLGIGE